MSKSTKILYAVLMFLVLAAPTVSLAILSTPQPPVGGGVVTLSELEDTVRAIARFLIVISIVIAVIFIIWGGIRWMAAMGNDTAVEEAKKTIKNGIYGAAIVLGVGVILNTLAAVFTRDVFR
ncbi:MAG: hypothetical protein Q8P35_03410 [Candidatus Yanofskybacteria bacterium]|nr:hypothetical protein [Candidatus Yanofskybacteria bacterium]